MQLSVWFQFVDSMALGLAVCATLVHWAFAASTTNADAVDEETLLCTVSEATCLVWAWWTWSTVKSGELTVLPATNAEQVSQHIALFLAIQFLDVAVCTHCWCEDRPSNEIKIQILWSEVTSLVYRTCARKWSELDHYRCHVFTAHFTIIITSSTQLWLWCLPIEKEYPPKREGNAKRTRLNCVSRRVSG